MGQQCKVTGIVLSATNVSDYDKRVVLLTKEKGKIAAFARGARKVNSPYLAACQPFVYGTFTLFEGRTYSINNIEVEDYFEALKEDLNALYRGFYFCEMADYFTVEGNDELAIMQLLYVSLNALRKKKIPQALVQVIFELKILALFGLMMETGQCVVCQQKPEPSEIREAEKRELFFTRFSCEKGGLVCEKCHNAIKGTIPVLESTVYTLQYIMSQPVTKIYNFMVTEPVLKELIKISNEYQNKHVNHVFKSLEFLTFSL